MIEVTEKEVISLLNQLVAIPSLSGEEDLVSRFLENFLKNKGLHVHRKYNNIWVEAVTDRAKPTILLNSHMDTVKPVAGWTRDPYLPELHEGIITGLGCSDAGGSVVALLYAFLALSAIPDPSVNLIFLASAEEENSGPHGISTALEEIGPIDLAIVGEPTNLEMAVCERGLIVFDCLARGKAGHVAHMLGENAIYKAMQDIEVLKTFKFQKTSALLGEVSLAVTQIEGGYQHNVIPDECRFVVDVRTNEHYSNEEVVGILQEQLQSEIRPRSLRLRSSLLPEAHPLMGRALALGIPTFGSKTMSDQALIPAPSVKLGPGKSEFSHKADESIEISQIMKAIDLYYNLIKDCNLVGKQI